MGTIYKRSNTWWISYYWQGRQIRESTKSDKKMVAKMMLEAREAELIQGKLPRVFFEKVTFGELASDMVNDYKINGKKSLRRVEEVIRLHLEPFFGRFKAPDIDTSKIREYIAARIEAGAANATVNRELSYLKRMLNLGARHTPPKVDRVPFFPMLRENNIRKGFFEHGDFLKFRAALPPHLQGFVTFAYKTGWRRGEISNLTWDRVNLGEGIVRLEAGETKSGEARTVYLDDELKAIIKKQFTGRRLGCPYVFYLGGEPIGEFRRSWATACRVAKMKGKLFHDLRRTAVRNMVRSGIPERVAMTISGHKTRSIFDRYNIVNDEDLRNAAKMQSEYLEKL